MDRAIIVARITPGAESAVAEIFKDSDATALPHELGVTRDRREPETRFGRRRRQRAQEVPDVALVPRPAAPEHVRVDDDQSHASSRQSASTRSASPIRRAPRCPT